MPRISLRPSVVPGGGGGQIYRRTHEDAGGDRRCEIECRVGKLARAMLEAARHKGSPVTRCRRLLKNADQSGRSGRAKDIEARIAKRNTGILLPGDVRARL